MRVRPHVYVTTKLRVSDDKLVMISFYGNAEYINDNPSTRRQEYVGSLQRINVVLEGLTRAANDREASI